jgi:hypothetical protein
VNVFLDLAQQQISAPRKVQQRAVEKRAQRKALVEHDQLQRWWRRWRQERTEELLATHGEKVRELVAFLDRMTPSDGMALIARVEAWRQADNDTRFEILSLVDNAIVRLREAHDLPPFDDPLPDEPPNVFLLIREALS